jgi:hypothetical protein
MTALVIVLTLQAIVYACHAYQVLTIAGMQP